MIEIPPMTDELLRALGEELGSRSFTGPNQKAFLSATNSRDVQAAPGNGKTTLLVAKLVLLSRTWTSRQQGVCVISHTNAARKEIEDKLAAHPSASAFLSYPHFIGTVTAFIHQFLALPYLRGLGWSVQRIDDDVFRAVIGGRWRSYEGLRGYNQNPHNRHRLQRFLAGLELSPDFEAVPDIAPEQLEVRHVPHQPRPPSAAGFALQRLKADMIKDGLYRYGDMVAIARQALEKYPALPQRVRARFPLVLLDEAQDTNGPQLELLQRLFDEGVAYQRLGDQNQTLYEEEGLEVDDYWRAGPDVIPLDKTRRFGPEIAAFASRLTVRAPQQIEGTPGIRNRRTLILFDRGSIGRVLPTYAAEIRAHWPANAFVGKEIWAVASRHNPGQGDGGNWPKSLTAYCPRYRGGRGRNGRPETLCAALRQASVVHQAQTSPAEIADLMTTGIVVLLRHRGAQDASGALVTKRTVWNVLATEEGGLPLKVKRLMRDYVLAGDDVWRAEAWAAFCRELQELLRIGEATEATTAFLAFVNDGAIDADAPGPEATTSVMHEGVAIQLGSVHSVKGKTADAMLMVETEVWRDNHRRLDLGLVLPQAFAITETDFTANPAHLSAATNVFVAVTRPREVLALALRKDRLGRTPRSGTGARLECDGPYLASRRAGPESRKPAGYGSDRLPVDLLSIDDFSLAV